MDTFMETKSDRHPTDLAGLRGARLVTSIEVEKGRRWAEAKIKSLTGKDAQTACSGFKNLGQCVAAAHGAKNLDIPGGFDALKAKVTGTGSMSLGKAIAQLSPNANAKSETKKANKQADDDMKDSSS